MSVFEYEPFEEKFEEKFSEEFPQVKKLFEQRPDDRKYPFKFDPVVNGRKNVGIKPDDEIQREKTAESLHLQSYANDMLNGSRVLSKLTGVNEKEDLSRRKKCCCPDDAIIQWQGWTSEMDVDDWTCPSIKNILKPTRGIGMCPLFRPPKGGINNHCAWQFQQFCPYELKKEYMDAMVSLSRYDIKDIEKMTEEEKKAVLKEYKEPDEIRDKVRLKIAENRRAYVRYCEAIQKKNAKNGITTLA